MKMYRIIEKEAVIKVYEILALNKDQASDMFINTDLKPTYTEEADYDWEIYEVKNV